MDGEHLPLSGARGDNAPLYLRLWDRLSSWQQRGAAVNASTTIHLSFSAQAPLSSGSVLTVEGFLNVAPDAAAVARGKASAQAGSSSAPLLPLTYDAKNAQAAGSFARWIAGVVPPPPPPVPGFGFGEPVVEMAPGAASIELTLVSDVAANTSLHLWFPLDTGLIAQSSQELKVKVQGSDAMPLVAPAQTLEEEGVCEMVTLYLNSMRLVATTDATAAQLNSDATIPPFRCVQWNSLRGRLTMQADSNIPAQSLIGFHIYFVNSGFTQEPPLVSVKVGDMLPQELGGLSSGDERALRVRMWDRVSIGHSTSDPGQLNTVYITLAPYFTLFPPSTFTVGGLGGTDMVYGVENVVDCVPSPCLSLSGSTETWDRGKGSLTLTLLANEQLQPQ